MLEEEAKTKWCPQNLGLDSANEHGLCIGSQCMMWEAWEYEDQIHRGTSETEIKLKGEGDCGLKTKAL